MRIKPDTKEETIRQLNIMMGEIMAISDHIQYLEKQKENIKGDMQQFRDHLHVLKHKEKTDG